MPRASLAAWLLSCAAACGSGPPERETPDAGRAAPPDASRSDAAGQSDASGQAHRVIFVTSSKHNGDLGGLAGADDICAGHAADAGLAGDFLAWLSGPPASAAERLEHAAVPYLRTDGERVADDWADLVDGELAAAIDRDEAGLRVSGDVWTGTLASGEPAEATCGGFAETAGSGLCGNSSSVGASWTDNIEPPCTSALRLYCVQQP